MSQSHSHRQLSLPTGTETLQLAEAGRHRRITRTLEDHFLRWGYRPAETPLVDYFEVYRRLLSEQDVSTMYRAVDRHGDILAVRSDTTLFLAKQLGLHLDQADLPVRVFYNDQIVRAEDRHDISNHEYQQAGIELVGVPGDDGDTEVLLLAIEALDALRLEETVIHVGSRHVVDAAIERMPADSRDTLATRDTIMDALLRRDRETLLAAGLSEATAALLLFIGTPQELRTYLARENAISSAERTAAERLSACVESAVTMTQPDQTWSDRVRIDLSEIGPHRIYTGLAFSAYVPEVNDAVIRGGRYDTLLRDFGFDAPSVGFSMYTRKLPTSTCREDADAPSHASGSTLLERVTDARTIHLQGGAAHL